MAAVRCEGTTERTHGAEVVAVNQLASFDVPKPERVPAEVRRQEPAAVRRHSHAGSGDPVSAEAMDLTTAPKLPEPDRPIS